MVKFIALVKIKELLGIPEFMRFKILFTAYRRMVAQAGCARVQFFFCNRPRLRALHE
jgi:hypothetical protein